MNLQEFLQYRTHCVCCGEPLIAKINSTKQVTTSDNVSEFEIGLKAIKRGHKSYVTKFTVLNATNDFCVAFKQAKKDEPFLGYVPIHIINRLKEYFENNKCYIVASCPCKMYNYLSNRFELDYKTGKLPDITLEEENVFEFWLKSGKKMWLKNNYNTEETCLYSPPDSRYSSKYSSISEVTKIPIVKLTTLEETTVRINKLLIFS